MRLPACFVMLVLTFDYSGDVIIVNPKNEWIRGLPHEIGYYWGKRQSATYRKEFGNSILQSDRLNSNLQTILHHLSPVNEILPCIESPKK